MARVQIRGFRCERCSHEWAPREPNQAPTVCPKCKSPYWNRPRKDDVKPEHRVICEWKAPELDGKTVEYTLAKKREGIGWFSVSDLGEGALRIVIRPVTGESDIMLTQVEADAIKSYSGKYRFSCFSRS
jgi:hypothetical protein